MDQPFYTIDQDVQIPIIIIYLSIMTISIIDCRIWYKRFKNLPDKQVTANLIKTSYYFGHGESYYDLHYSYKIAKYEYYLNGKRHTIKLKCPEGVSDQIILYYKKGRRDIRTDKKFFLPENYKFVLLVYFVVGVAVITVYISQYLGFITL